MKMKVGLMVNVIGILLPFLAIALPYKLNDVPRGADVSISGVYLFSPTTFKRVLHKPNFLCDMEWYEGKSLDDDVVVGRNGEPCYYNQDRAEIMEASYGHGAYIDEYYMHRFYVRHALKTKNELVPVLKNVQHFRSGKGIMLGMTQQQVIDILGRSCMKAYSNDGFNVLEYQIQRDSKCVGPKGRRFAGEFGYYSTYLFKNGHLVMFEFGYALDV